MRRLDFFTKDRGFTYAKAQREIGYQPRVSLEEGFARTAAWYRQAQLL
jgi:nucleoside-diphosphate-sugar epimerase